MDKNEKLDLNPYSVQKFISESPENLRIAQEEYRHLRSVANKRIDRLSESKFSKTAENYKDEFPKLSDIRSKRELSMKLSSVAAFINSPHSTIRGNKEIRKRSIETLQSRGFDFVNEKNFDDFTQYMDAIRELNLDKSYYSELVNDKMFQSVINRNKEQVVKGLKQFAEKKRTQSLSRVKQKRRKAQAEQERKAAIKSRSKTESARNAKQKRKGKKKSKKR